MSLLKSYFITSFLLFLNLYASCSAYSQQPTLSQALPNNSFSSDLPNPKNYLASNDTSTLIFELFEKLCLQNTDNFALIDNQMNLYKGTLEPEEDKTKVSLRKTFSLKYKGEIFFVAYTTDNTCAILSEGIYDSLSGLIKTKLYGKASYIKPQPNEIISESYILADGPYKGSRLFLSSDKKSNELGFMTLIYSPRSNNDVFKNISKSNNSLLDGKNASWIALQVFDGLCIKNSNNYQILDKMMQGINAEKLDGEFTKALLLDQKGNAYRFKYNELEFFGAYIENGGCSIITMPINPQEISSFLEKEFKAFRSHKDDMGTQVTEIFTIQDTPLHTGDRITLTYSKSDLTMGTIGYLPSKLLSNIHTPPKSCAVNSEIKEKLTKILCSQDSPEIVYRFYGSKCFEKSFQKRIEDTALQIYMFNKCGDVEYAQVLEDTTLKHAKVMEILALCIGENISINSFYTAAKEKTLEKYKDESCSTEMKNLISQNKIKFEGMVKSLQSISSEDLFEAFGLTVTKDGTITSK